MSRMTEFIIGAAAWCIDGPCGQLRRIVIDPDTRAVTHLVIDAGHRQVNSHLVPIDLVNIDALRNQLRCTLAEFEETEGAREWRPSSETRGQSEYERRSIFSAPNKDTPSGGQGVSGMSDIVLGMEMGGTDRTSKFISSEKLPEGKVDLRRGDRMLATDGLVGHVQGVVVDPDDTCVAYVILDESNFWGPKQVAIPIDAVTEINAGIELSLSKDEVRKLPPVDIDRYR